MLDVAATKQLRDFTLNIHFSVTSGEILVLAGANGAGKSTTLNIISGLLVPDAGKIVLGKKCVFNSSGTINIPPEDREIGYVFQKSAVFPHLSVRDNIAFGLRAHHTPASLIDERVKYWIEAFDLRDLARVKADRLSGGQKQRVALARAFAPAPSLLMLDEPFTALDEESLLGVRNTIRNYVTANRIPCLLVTHQIETLAGVADRTVIMDRGIIVSQGKPAEQTNSSNKPVS